MTLSEAYEHIKIDYNVMINGKMVYRALKEARERVIGNERAQYSKLRDYLTEIHRSNPGSSTILDVTPIPQSLPLFNRLYVSLDACKRGIKAGCRKLGLNDCFLKGYFGGQLLSAGLLPALKEVIPHAHHRNCVRHIWKNFTNRYKDKQVKNIVWECAKCTTDAEFKASMKKLKRINEEAWSYLEKFEPACWTKAHFSHGPKCDNLTNNMCEVWNAKIVNYRSKPILTMCEELRCYIMRRMTKYKQVLETYIGTEIAPTQQKRFDDIMKDVRYWQPVWVGDDERRVFEVQQGSKKLSVNLSTNKCLPCVHALAAIARRGDRPETYVHPLLKIGAAIATYQHCIQPVNSKEYWEKTNYLKPIPPKLKRPVGRPIKRRRKESSETEVSRTDGNKVKKTFRVTCSKCGELCHNYMTCKGPPTATTRRPTNPNRRKTMAGANPGTSNQPADEIHFSPSAPQVQAADVTVSDNATTMATAESPTMAIRRK
ncbi:uncharacterized protein [Arachis hypogaea]|uniref:uncharacterized protein n=1 Tax=Arachis hypogaea TaxID=3818 RepID=UPI003B210312